MATKVGEGYVEIRPDTKTFFGTLRGMAGPIAGILGGLAVGKALFVDPLKSAAEFTTTLNVLQAQSGATGEQMKTLSGLAIKLGSDVKLPGTSAQDAASAMLELSKGGLSLRDSMAAARPTLVAAAAAQIDNAQAAKIVAGALGAFELKGQAAGKVADLLAGAANASSGEMTDYAAALQQVGAQAHSLHVPITDTVTALALLSKAGIQGSDAGTSLKTFMQRLVPTTEKARDAYKSLGVSVFDANGKFIGLEPALARLREGLTGLTDKQKQQRLATIFGSDALRAASILTRGTEDNFASMREEVGKSGQAQKLAAAQSKGLGGAMQGLQSTVETLQLEIGLKLAPYVEQFVRWFTAVLPTAIHTSMAVIETVAPIVAAVFGTVFSIIGQVVSFIADHADLFGPLAAGIAIAVGLFFGLQLAMVGLTVVTYALGTALAFVFSPVVLIVVAIGLLIGALIYAYTHFETFRNIVNSAMQAVLTVVTTVFNLIRAYIQLSVAFYLAIWNRFGSTIIAMARVYFQGILGVIRGVMQIIRGVINVVLGLIHGDFGRVWTGIKQIVSGAIQAVLGFVRAAYGPLFTAAVALGRAVLEGIANKARELPGKIREIVGQIPGLIRSAAGAVIGAAASIGEAIVTGILNGVGNLGSALKDSVESKVKGALDSINPFSPVEHGGEMYIGRPIVAGALSGVASLGPELRGAIERAVGGAVPAAGASGVPVPFNVAGAADGAAGGGGVTVMGNLIVQTPNAGSFASDLHAAIRGARRR